MLASKLIIASVVHAVLIFPFYSVCDFCNFSIKITQFYAYFDQNSYLKQLLINLKCSLNGLNRINEVKKDGKNYSLFILNGIAFFTVWMITTASSLVLDRLKGPGHHKLRAWYPLPIFDK